MKTMQEIMRAINEAHENGVSSFGVRQGRVAVVGEELECSHDWDYENDKMSEELLDGTCATSFGYLWFDEEEADFKAVEKAIEFNRKYYGDDMMYIIGGDYEECGADEGEVIIGNARVICIID